MFKSPLSLGKAVQKKYKYIQKYEGKECSMQGTTKALQYAHFKAALHGFCRCTNSSSTTLLAGNKKGSM